MADEKVFEAVGKLHVIKDTQQITERFQKREFVIEVADNPAYPQLIQFQLTGDRVDIVDGLNIGDVVRIKFNLRGREWTSPQGEVRYFNSLDAWTIAVASPDTRSQNVPATRTEEEPPPFEDDDIPF